MSPWLPFCVRCFRLAVRRDRRGRSTSPDYERRTAPAVPRCWAIVSFRRDRHRRCRVAEVRIPFPGLRIERHQVLASERDDPGVAAVGPIREATAGRAGSTLERVAGLSRRRRVEPHHLAGGRDRARRPRRPPCSRTAVRPPSTACSARRSAPVRRAIAARSSAGMTDWRQATRSLATVSLLI